MERWSDSDMWRAASTSGRNVRGLRTLVWYFVTPCTINGLEGPAAQETSRVKGR
jgi:hypothetical protein